jgi:dihydrodipicolinate synthase/N-acetylneuraminate lyase
MDAQDLKFQFGRRQLLQSAGALAIGAAVQQSSGAANASGEINRGNKSWQGLFPIAQTPFTADDKLDHECLAAEVEFCNRGRVPGFIWPQGSSGWTSLSVQERLDGAETILSAAKGKKTTIVVGVQPLDGDVNVAIRYAKHAAQHGADGLISLPPGIVEGKPAKELSDQAVLDYFKAVGAATDLPLMIQSHGDMSVDLILALYEQVPTIKSVKDEAGDPLVRFPEFKKRTDNKLLVYLANGAGEMIEGMRLGFDGYIPKTGLADLSQIAYELWNAGKQKDAFDMFGRVQAFQTITGAMQYLLTARGVFKETTTIRDARRMFGPRGMTPDDAQKKFIRAELEKFLGSYLQA